MKTFFLLSLGFVAAVVVSLSIGYRIGSQRRDTWIKSDFIGCFATLQSLRAGDSTGAVERLEAKTFSLANEIYGTPGLRSDPMPQMFLKDLRDYRAKYRTNAAQWYPTEHRLEQNLATWK